MTAGGGTTSSCRRPLRSASRCSCSSSRETVLPPRSGSERAHEAIPELDVEPMLAKGDTARYLKIETAETGAVVAEIDHVVRDCARAQVWKDRARQCAMCSRIGAGHVGGAASRLALPDPRSGRATDGSAAPVPRPPTSTSRGFDRPSRGPPCPRPCDDAMQSWHTSLSGTSLSTFARGHSVRRIVVRGTVDQHTMLRLRRGIDRTDSVGPLPTAISGFVQPIVVRPT